MQENTNLMTKNGNLMQENTNECSSSSTKQHLMVCPICDKKFDVDAISAHADQCASRHEMPHTINCIDPFFDEVEEEEGEAHDVVSGFNTVTQSSLFNILSTVIPPNDESNDETALRLEVRRVHVFDDFKNYFDRKWNIKKKDKRLQISFIGESGVDTGGVGRDFFCRKFIRFHHTFLIIYF